MNQSLDQLTNQQTGTRIHWEITMPIFLKHTFEAISYSLQLAPINFIILHETNWSGPIGIFQGFFRRLIIFNNFTYLQRKYATSASCILLSKYKQVIPLRDKCSNRSNFLLYLEIMNLWCGCQTNKQNLMQKICFPEDSHPWPTEHQGQLLEPAGQQGLGKLHCIHKPLLVWSADWTKISEYPFYCYRLQITDYKANHEFLNLIIIMLNKLLYEVWKVFGRLKH